MTFRKYVPIVNVRGHVVRHWKRDEKERRGFNGVECFITRFLLDDGRLVEQEWPVGVERPSAHYVVASAHRTEQMIAAMGEVWTELDPADYPPLGGVRR